MPFVSISGSVKIEDLPKSMQEQLDVDPALIRSKEEREELAEQVKGQMEQQQGAQDAAAPAG
jgi:hypothetical protein